jgi:hypothetical protein
MRVRLEVPDVREGGRVAGTLHIENLGDGALEEPSPLSAAALNVVVFDRYWNAVEPEPQGKANVGFEAISLEPGDTRQFELVDLAFTSGTARFAYRLPPGRHFAVALYHPGTSRLPEESDYPRVVASNVASFDVAGVAG